MTNDNERQEYLARVAEMVPLIRKRFDGDIRDSRTWCAVLLDMVSRLGLELGTLQAEMQRLKDLQELQRDVVELVDQHD